MTIPDGREVAANWVLQFALVTFVLNLWSTPYNAALIAHEKWQHLHILEYLKALQI